MAKETVFDDDAAFARPTSKFSPGDSGLTKREYFAALAMQGLCDRQQIGLSLGPDEIAKLAVEIADAVINRLNETLKS